MVDKKNLPSRHVSVGPNSAPHRAFYYAMGMTEKDISQPFVGVATTWNEAAPCNISLSCLLYTSPSPRDRQKSRMPSSA